METDEKKIPKKRRIWLRVAVWTAVLALVVAAVATFPEGWGPRLVSSVICRSLPHGEGYDNEIAIQRISLNGLKVGRVRLGGLPAMPSCDAAEARYSLAGLLRKRIDSIAIFNLMFRPEYTVTNFTMASEAFAGEIVLNPDPLQGWSLGLAECETGAIDFTPLLDPKTRAFFPSSTARVRVRIELGQTGYGGRVDGEFWGGNLVGRLGYVPETRTGSVTAPEGSASRS